MIVLDVDLTGELEDEGHARDVVRMVQQGRRAAGLRVTDRIELRAVAPGDVAAALAAHQAWIAEQVLAVSVEVAGADDRGGAAPG